ncbi:MAG: hypothetical protein WA839_14970 [Flavobacteriaceae bacterium]
MADFPWLMWVISTVALEAFLMWYIRRAERTSTIVRGDFPLKGETVLAREEDKPLFDHLIRTWRKLMYLVPFITFGLLYFGDH